ncbi:AAA family ATPase, partial [Sphingomonas sp.]|uniref:AAA family ATPase n=1 Tax=Sphingomonas sp. TaxID=28214 RepID=UPI003B3AC94C
MVALSRLSLTNFRNHAEALIAPGVGFVILTGENGAGKTNILEAVSLLTPGRGLRGATLSDMARADGPGGFAVNARLGDAVDIGTGTLAAAPERRQVRINGADASAA